MMLRAAQYFDAAAAQHLDAARQLAQGAAAAAAVNDALWQVLREAADSVTQTAAAEWLEPSYQQKLFQMQAAQSPA
jgi:hypothetical protein